MTDTSMHQLCARLLEALRVSDLADYSVPGLRPGVPEDEFRSFVRSALPALADNVDDTVLAWWSWHNGTTSRVRIISPDFLGLVSLEELPLIWDVICERAETVRGHTCLLPLDDYPAFPIGSCMLSDTVFLQRASNDDPWQIWRFDKDSLITPPHRRIDGPPVLFTDYLETLIEALPRVSRDDEMAYPFTTVIP